MNTVACTELNLHENVYTFCQQHARNCLAWSVCVGNVWLCYVQRKQLSELILTLISY